jgi:PAS domain S-box-containing protein
MLVQSEYPTLIPRILEKIRNDDPIQRYEGIRIGKGGTKTDVSVNITSVRDSEGRIVGGVEMTRDVSRRNRAEQLLAKSRDFYLKLFEDFPALIWRSDSSGVFDYLNRCWLEFTGSTLESGLKNDWPGRVHPEDRKRVARAYQGAFRKRVPLRVEYRFRRADGSYRWIINQGRPYTDLDGTFAGFIGSCYDGTEMREAVEDHRRLMAAIEQASDAIVITAVDATIQYVNPAFERITGYSQRQAVGKNLSILRSGKHDAHFHADITNTVLTGNVWSGQLINRRKDGSCYTEFMTLSPVRNAAGKTINLVAISRDVSEQVAMETQLRQAQRLESIGQLAAGIAHEINTPTQYVGDNTLFLKDAFADLLTVLEAYASLATSAADGPVPYDLLKSVEDAVRAADIEYLAAEIPKAISQSQEGIERVAGIVRAMKEFSHPGTGEKTLLDINRAIETTLTVARNEWKYVAELELDLQPDLPMVPCLPGDMNQVILNIVVNAAHAITDVVGKDGASGKGIIRVQTRTSGRSVEIRITDSGNGIPEHVRARVFDPFFTTKGVGKGTGQGLAISHSVIVDKHGGTISFESESGKGTTFIVRLPLDGAAREAGPAAFEGDPASSGLPQHGDTGGESRGA